MLAWVVQKYHRSVGRLISKEVAVRLSQKVSVFGVLVLLSCGVVWAQSDSANFPQKPVHMAMNHGPAGSSGTMAELMREKLAAELGQDVVLDFGDGSGLRGNDATRAAAPDGHTIALATTASLFSPPVADEAYGVDRMQDLVAVTNIADTPDVLVIRTGLPATTFEEFVALAKARPGELTYRTGGGIHALEMLAVERAAGVQLKGISVPAESLAPGGNSQTAPIVQGKVDLLITTGGYMLPHIRSGAIRALAIAFDRRSESFPGVPTMTEVGVPLLPIGSWMGLFAPPGTPPAIVKALHAAARRAAEDPEVKSAAAAGGFSVATSPSPASFRTFIDEDVPRLASAIEALGFRRD